MRARGYGVLEASRWETRGQDRHPYGEDGDAQGVCIRASLTTYHSAMRLLG